MLVIVCTSIWMAKYADLSPLILIEPVDFAELQGEEGKYMGMRRIITEDRQRLLDMPLTEYTTEKTEGRLFQVEGKQWKEIFQNLITLKEEKKVAKEWSKRLPTDQYPGAYFFFKPDESPINAFRNYFKQKHDEVYVSLTEGNKTRYLKLQYRTYSDDDFHFGSGFSNYPTPPTYMLFPYRQYSLYTALSGLLIYIFIPRQKQHPQAIRYPLWRIFLGDVVAMLVIVPFFSFPFFIVGGSTQVFTEGWPFLLFFWPVFFLGVWLLTISAWFASFSLVMMNDRLKFSTHKGEREFSYKDMEYFQPVIFKPPKWLIVLSWLAALSAKGSMRVGAVGRAMILSGAEYGSLSIRLKNGADIFINITDQMGSTALKGFERIVERLKENGVLEKNEVREIRSLGLETVKLPDK